jgi:hypothetical protein
MRIAVRGLLAFSLLFVVAGQAQAKCGDNPGDAAAVADARDEVDAECNCAGVLNHGTFVKCAKEIAKARVEALTLPKNCKGAVVRCAAKSTCGKPGFVTCCRTNAKGVTKCSTKSDGALCKPPKDGSACVSTFTSCCDACTETGCAASPSGAFLDGKAAGF